MVEKCKIYLNTGSNGSSGAEHLTKKFAWMAEIGKIVKVSLRVVRRGGGGGGGGGLGFD